MTGGVLREEGIILGEKRPYVGGDDFSGGRSLFEGFLVNQRQGARGPGYPYGILELGSRTGFS